jgi:tripartite-type tricarboxylate transporter receptor subunit TctC
MRIRLTRVVARTGAALALAGFALAASAQGYPSKIVRLISQFPPGGGTDLIARLLAPKLTEAWGQQVIVENRAGAAGNVAAEYVAKSPADGYTVLVANNTIVINASLYQKLSYDLVRDLNPVAVVGSTPVALAVHPSMPVKSVKELVALARANPGKLTYSSCGNGTAMHLAAELLKQLSKIDMIHVPYKGCGPAVAEGIAGQVPILFNTLTNTMPQANAGRLRILALASATRSPVDAKIPTIAESGFKDYDANIWFGFFVPAGTPRGLITKINADVNRIVEQADIKERMRSMLFDQRTGTPEQFADLIKSDLAKWGKLIKDANIQLD